ncbi:apolipoprotein D-like [Ctenocephalides felis]|uniref:apolipoprotein D-like n=1 Tax=Ctenocephalides felis TaxID=7515 RepID=UPI000E6E214A|nr:apolipoprotein D-like [Ctenocephalides felis]
MRYLILPILFVCLATTFAQIPQLGFCPDVKPMQDFDMEAFLGDWFETERYFTVSELGRRCVFSNYERRPDGSIRVSNQMTNAFTNVKRTWVGELSTKGENSGSMLVKYNTLPVSLDTSYSVLDTDYDTYAVVYNCNPVGPIHTQSCWVLTRERNPPSAVLQRAYGILDKYKISRTFFVKTNQQDCE